MYGNHSEGTLRYCVRGEFDTFEDYFTECTETTLKEHYVILYEVSLCISTYILAVQG